MIHIRRPLSAYAFCGEPASPNGTQERCEACQAARKAARAKFGTRKRRARIWHVWDGVRACVGDRAK